MSLLDQAFEYFIIMNKSITDDGMGGVYTTWTEGATIEAALSKNHTMEALVAQASGVTAVYTITTRKNISLEYHDVLKRVSNGTFFRVTSDGIDNATPISAHLNMRQVSCEEWILNA